MQDRGYGLRRIYFPRTPVNGACMRLHCRARQTSRPEVANSGILFEGKVRHSHAQINGGGGQRSVFCVSSGGGGGPDPVVVDGSWAGARTPAVLGAGTGARRGTAPRGPDRAGSGVRAFRRGGLRDTSTGRRTRASGRRRGVSLRSQSHVRGATGDHRWPVVAFGPARITTVRRCHLGGRSGVRAVLRGTHPHAPLRGGLRGLPARSPCLVAPPASLGT